MQNDKLMKKFIETNNYQNPDCSEFTDITPCEDETADGLPIIVKQPNNASANDVRFVMPSDWNHHLTISAIVKVESCEIDSDSVCNNSAFCKKIGISDTLTSFIISGTGMSPTFTFFPVEIYTESFPIESLDEMIELYKPGSIFVAEGEYGIFEPHKDTIVIFQASIKWLPQNTVAILDKNFQQDEKRI